MITIPVKRAVVMTAIVACHHDGGPTTTPAAAPPVAASPSPPSPTRADPRVEAFEHGVRSRALEERMRPLLEKHTAAGNPPVGYDFECRDRMCRIQPKEQADWQSLSEALRAVASDQDSRRELISSVSYHSRPYVAYWEISDDNVADFRRDLSAKLRSEVLLPCKQQHPERGDVSFSFEAVDGKLLPVLTGPLAPTPMGNCLRAALAKLVDGIEVPSGFLPFHSMLRLLPP